MRRKALIILGIILLEGCTPSAASPSPTQLASPSRTPSPTSTPTEIPTPTHTPIPTFILSGTVFFDYNGSGEQDLAYAMDSDDPLEEPAIAGVQICLDGRSECRITDEDGIYTFEVVLAATHRLRIESPSDDPATAFRYINISHGWVDIPAYEMNGVQVPAQHLADTEIQPIDGFISIEIEEDTSYDIALMQGFLTLPLREQDIDQLVCITGFDHDSRPGRVIDWKGDTSQWIPGANSPCDGVWDTHTGIDYLLPEGLFEVAAMPGVITHEFINPDNGARVARLVNIDVQHRSGYYVALTYGHHSQVLIDNMPGAAWTDRIGVKVYRGQIILAAGMTGTHSPHLHFGFHANSLPGYGEEFIDIDPYGIENSEVPSPDQISAWTAHNMPIAPLTDMR